MLDKKIFSVVPKTCSQLQSLIGSLNSARPLIPNLSQKIIRITDKLKNSKIKLNENDSAIFKEIKQEILDNDGLYHGDLNKNFVFSQMLLSIVLVVF